MKKLYKDNMRLDYKARMLLHQCISAAIFQKVSKAVTAKEVWDILQEGYGNSGNFVAIEECKDLETMRVEELQRLMERKNAEKGLNQGTNQALQARNDQKFKGRGAGRGRGRSRGKKKRFGEEGRLLATAAGRLAATSSLLANANATAAGRPRRDLAATSLQPRHNLAATSPPPRQGTPKYEHYSSECWHNEAVKKGKNDEANLAQDTCDSESDHVLLMSTIGHDEDELCWKLTLDRCEEELGHALDRCNRETDHMLLSNATSHVEDESCWYLDTGCSNHMTGKREWLIDLDTSIKSNVRFVDNSVIMAEGAGKVSITRKDGRFAYMINVLYVPTMRSNLLSLGQLLEKGYTMSMEQKHIEVFDERQLLVLKAPLARNKTFKVNLNPTIVQCLAAVNIEEEGWLWLYRFGHLNFKSLSQLKGKELIKGVLMIYIPDKVCEGCAIWKQTKNEFKKSALKRAKQPLEVIYSDVCGPFDV
ncbi:uncharacterized protein LOC124833595 [Vigna umbellata]|uniref:uncharacterized protein LOC124833595 n=1 Tax=Vigna umbellata TaxID=87088 RepID=UPI001F5F295C|nr:uncharacterized protein LOC124833595 [Vigna umbellata]